MGLQKSLYLHCDLLQEHETDLLLVNIWVQKVLLQVWVQLLSIIAAMPVMCCLCYLCLHAGTLRPQRAQTLAPSVVKFGETLDWFSFQTNDASNCIFSKADGKLQLNNRAQSSLLSFACIR